MRNLLILAFLLVFTVVSINCGGEGATDEGNSGEDLKVSDRSILYEGMTDAEKKEEGVSGGSANNAKAEKYKMMYEKYKGVKPDKAKRYYNLWQKYK